jgi:hypothetical protein
LGGLHNDQWRRDSFSGPTPHVLRVEIVNPPYGFLITHFSQVTLRHLEDDFVHRVLLDSIPANRWPVPKELLHHGGVAGISDALVDIVSAWTTFDHFG